MSKTWKNFLKPKMNFFVKSPPVHTDFIEIYKVYQCHTTISHIYYIKNKYDIINHKNNISVSNRHLTGTPRKEGGCRGADEVGYMRRSRKKRSFPYGISTCVSICLRQHGSVNPNSSKTTPSGVLSKFFFVRYTTLSVETPSRILIWRTLS